MTDERNVTSEVLINYSVLLGKLLILNCHICILKSISRNWTVPRKNVNFVAADQLILWLGSKFCRLWKTLVFSYERTEICVM